MPRHSPQAGQSLVETTLLGIFVLVPLFLVTLLLGKYVDLQDSTLQATRNAAFERTVWSETGQRDGMTTAQEGNVLPHPQVVSFKCAPTT